MLAPHIIEHTDYGKFFEQNKFFDTYPVQFIHTKFSHIPELTCKFMRFHMLSNVKFINTAPLYGIILTDNPIFAIPKM